MKILVGIAAIAALGAAVPAQGSGGGQTDVWAHLSRSYDKNDDGKVTKDEYSRGEAAFGNLDRNDDGVLTEADFERRSRGGRGGGRGGGRNMSRSIGVMVARVADLDENGEVTITEFKALIVSVSDDDGTIDQEALVEKIPMRGGRGGRGGQRGGQGGGNDRMIRMMISALDKDQNGDIESEDLMKIFAELDRNKDNTLARDELGGNRRGGGRPARSELPQAGEAAPDFELPYADDKDKTIKLSSYAGQKPVALIFGSYT